MSGASPADLFLSQLTVASRPAWNKAERNSSFMLCANLPQSQLKHSVVVVAKERFS
jgi:hypothetical protein